MSDPELEIRMRNLPHWSMAHATYFVTFNQANGIIDFTRDECQLIQQVLLDHHSIRYHLWAWVVMNDHVHTVLTPLDDWTLGNILHTWKSFAANQLQREHQRQGQVWQHDSHDRIIRSEEELHQKCEYILANPGRRWPSITDYEWSGYNWK